MNVLLDLVVCGPGARLCGGLTHLLSKDRNVYDDPKFWDDLAGRTSPPIPKEIHISKSSESDDENGSVSSLEISKAFRNRHEKDWVLVATTNSKEKYDLELEELLEGSSDVDSLEMSSFDSRTGDTRDLTKEEEHGQATTGRDRKPSWDGSSYSSYYFRLHPTCTSAAKSPERVKNASSWQTTSTRTTRSARNPSRYPKYK